jgi:hypothetical protein
MLDSRPVAEPLEHDVVVVEHDGAFTLRRAMGLGVSTRNEEGAPFTTGVRAEAIAAGDQLAAQNAVDLWVLDGHHATQLASHRRRGVG